jgi:hypothetical protein
LVTALDAGSSLSEKALELQVQHPWLTHAFAMWHYQRELSRLADHISAFIAEKIIIIITIILYL